MNRYLKYFIEKFTEYVVVDKIEYLQLTFMIVHPKNYGGLIQEVPVIERKETLKKWQIEAIKKLKSVCIIGD